MKYVVELKKCGTVKGWLVRATEEEARKTAERWLMFSPDNSADWHTEENIQFAVYQNGKLDCVVDDIDLDRMRMAGMMDDPNIDYILIRDGKIFKTLYEAVMARMPI